MKVRLTPAFKNTNLVIPLEPDLQREEDRISNLIKKLEQVTRRTDIPFSSIVRSGVEIAHLNDEVIERETIAGLRDGKDWTDICFKLKNGRYPTDEENRKMQEKVERSLREGPSREQRIVQDVLASLHPCDE